MNKKKFVNENGPCWDGYKQVGMKMKSGREVPNCVPESVEMNEENEPTNPALWSRAKSAAKAKYDVYPSAYANAFASKWYKEKGGTWKTKSESVSERFDKTHLDMLKQAYNDINKINPNSPAYNRLITMLDKLPKDELQQIADADIKFLSLLAKNRLMKNEQEIYSVKEGNAFTGALFNARKEGLTEFEFNGKMYPVKEANDETIVEVIKMKKSMNERISPKDMEAIKSAVQSASSFMNIGSELKKTGIRYIFATSPMPIYIVQDKSGNRVGIVNKKYATKPDFVVGDTAVGVMENKVNEANKGDFEIGDFVHFKSANKTGMVKKISGDTVTIMTMKGEFNGNLKDVKVLYQDEVIPSVNEDFKSVVGKTVFSDGKGKLHFGYYKEDDSAYFVDYKTWAKLGMKDVSKGDTNKDKVVSAILKNQKQFNKKVEYNMWAKKTNPSFEEKMDWFIKNGWISNINKGGIKESVNEAVPSQTKWAVAIASLTATRPEGVQKFIDDNNLDSTKLYSYLKKGKLSDKMDFVTAMVGNPGNKIQKMIISKFRIKESVNEGVKISLFDPNKNKILKTLSVDRNYREAEKEVETLNKRLSASEKNKGYYWKVTTIGESVNEALLPADTKVVKAFFDKKPLEGRNLNTDGKVLKTAGIGSQEMYTHTPNGVKMVGKITGKYAQSLVQFVNKNYKSDLVESVNEVKYPTDLKIGSVILGQGFTMLKGIEGGKYYKVVDMDDISATLVPSDKNGNVKGSKKVRHKLSSIDGGIKTAKRGDENGVIVIKESVNEASLSDIDIIAQEAKDFKDFVIQFYKEYKDFPKTKESMKWLAGVYKNRSKMEGLK
jgi:hypothetical protein